MLTSGGPLKPHKPAPARVSCACCGASILKARAVRLRGDELGPEYECEDGAEWCARCDRPFRHCLCP